MQNSLINLKSAYKNLLKISSLARRDLILAIAKEIELDADKIIAANDQDLSLNPSLSLALKDRLKFDKSKIDHLIDSLIQISNEKEVVGICQAGWVAKSGIKIEKISIPIGCIGVIYESRPEVTAHVAALCIKSANGCALKGGKEARNTNLAIVEAIHRAFEKCKIKKECVTYLDIDRNELLALIKMNDYLDLIIPRGGKGLINFIAQNSTIPVLKHDEGICHIYVDEFADMKKALDICINAKCSRPSVCNAAETFLVHEKIAKNFLTALKIKLDEFKVEIFGCEKTAALIKCTLATKQNYETEYLDYKVNIKIVSSLNEAIEHIQIYSSHHSEAVISQDYSVCEKFLSAIDSACVYANASTRFSDGGEFGFGAEVGISTNKLHARGPVGLSELTTYKYIIRGDGEIR